MPSHLPSQYSRAASSSESVPRTFVRAKVNGSLIEAGRYAGNEGVYHFTDEGVCSWYDFAVEIAAAAGHGTCRIIPCHTSEYPTKAQRPAYSVLDKTRFKETFQMDIPHWREALIYCMKRLTENNP